MKPFNFRQHQTVEANRPPIPQCFGRLFRVGRPKVVFTETVEEQIALKIKSKILALGSCGESTGVSLQPPENLNK